MEGIFFPYILQVSKLETLPSPRVLVSQMNALSQVDKHKKKDRKEYLLNAFIYENSGK